MKWITDGIYVRVISKRVAEGSLYNKKLPVITILDQYTFEVYSDELNREFTNLREKDVETVLPRSKDVQKDPNNCSVLIVRGRHRGQSGKIHSIDKQRDQVKILIDFSDLVTVSQDDCSLKSK